MHAHFKSQLSPLFHEIWCSKIPIIKRWWQGGRGVPGSPLRYSALSSITCWGFTAHGYPHTLVCKAQNWTDERGRIRELGYGNWSGWRMSGNLQLSDSGTFWVVMSCWGGCVCGESSLLLGERGTGRSSFSGGVREWWIPFWHVDFELPTGHLSGGVDRQVDLWLCQRRDTRSRGTQISVECLVMLCNHLYCCQRWI